MVTIEIIHFVNVSLCTSMPSQGVEADESSCEEKRQIAGEVKDAVRPFFPDGHMRFPAQMIIVSGKKPAYS